MSKTFHQKLLEKKEEEEEKIKLREKYNIEENIPIIIKKESFGIKLIKFLKNTLLFLIKGVFYFSLMILSSVGMTVLLNNGLRNIFFEFIKNTI